MRKMMLMGLYLLAACCVFGQKFEKKEQWSIPAGFTANAIEWMDVDSDSLLDVVVTSTATNGDGVLLMFKNNATDPFTAVAPLNTGMTQIAVYPADVDNDNNTDLIVSGLKSGQPAISFYVNKGGFVFDTPVYPEQLQEIQTSLLRMIDLNRDGTPDLAISGSKGAEDFLWLYQQLPTSWIARDSIQATVAGMQIVDYDGDGNNDILLSGHNADSVFTMFAHDAIDFKFRYKTVALGLEGKLTAGDLNHDGYFDAILSGQKNSANAIVLLRFNGENFSESETLPALSNAEAFIADMNSDGVADILLSGKLNATDTINLIRKTTLDYDTLNHTGVVTQRFGDVDRDGDLDVIQLRVVAGQQQLEWYANDAPVNKGPGAPSSGLGISLYGHLFLYWDEAADDHTATDALTYDLFIEAASGNIMSGDFNPGDKKRRLVSHGNTGTRNFALLNGDHDNNFLFTVQAVDNAFHTSKSVCSGVGGAPSCLQVTPVDVQTCGNEVLTLKADASALWFSFAAGYLGSGASFSTTPAASDTIFSFTPSTGPAQCALIKIYHIDVKEILTKTERNTRYACLGSVLTFSAEPHWNDVTWSSGKDGFISNDHTITYTVMTEDSVTVKLMDGSGCQIERITQLRISKPTLSASPDQQIIKGQSVNLEASSDSPVTFTWTPSAGLNQINISNPVATPLQTTEYTVTVADSIGCTNSEKVLVVVQETAFIPNLFTPNQDGNNDDLRIYGLSGVKDFSFSIYSREGSLVYQTDDVSEATTRGWDGTRNGKEQAGGVYYWKVKGEFTGGRSVLLNGKKTGSIVLIR